MRRSYHIAIDLYIHDITGGRAEGMSGWQTIAVLCDKDENGNMQELTNYNAGVLVTLTVGCISKSQFFIHY